MKRVSVPAEQARPGGTPAHEQRRRGRLSGESKAGRAETLPVPPRREPDHEQADVAACVQHAVLARRCQQRLGRDAQDPLNRQRAVRKQPARVAPAVLRNGRGPASRSGASAARANHAPSSTAAQS